MWQPEWDGSMLVDWGFFGVTSTKLEIGGDLNGTMPLTNDKHLLLGIEKQFISGQGGVVKFSTSGKIKWFHPLPDRKWYIRGMVVVVGSPSVNHRYNSKVSKDLALLCWHRWCADLSKS